MEKIIGKNRPHTQRPPPDRPIPDRGRDIKGKGGSKAKDSGKGEVNGIYRGLDSLPGGGS